MKERLKEKAALWEKEMEDTLICRQVKIRISMYTV